MKIKVVGVSNERASVLQLLLRSIVLLFWPIDAMLLLLGKCGISDKIAKTKVVRV